MRPVISVQGEMEITGVGGSDRLRGFQFRLDKTSEDFIHYL